MKKSIVILSFLFLCLGCKDKRQLYSDQNYSDLFLDEAAIDNFFKSNAETKSVQNQVSEFYTTRSYQYAWFNKNGMTQAVFNFYNQLQNYSSDFDDTSFNNSQLDSLITLIKANKYKEEYLDCPINNDPHSYYGTLEQSLEISGNKSRIIAWMVYWPWSLIWNVTGDFFTMIYETMMGVYQRIADKAVGKFLTEDEPKKKDIVTDAETDKTYRTPKYR